MLPTTLTIGNGAITAEDGKWTASSDVVQSGVRDLEQQRLRMGPLGRKVASPGNLSKNSCLGHMWL